MLRDQFAKLVTRQPRYVFLLESEAPVASGRPRSLKWIIGSRLLAIYEESIGNDIHLTNGLDS